MRVLINAVSIREGGALVVLVKLLEQFTELRPQARWLVATNERAARMLPKHVCIEPWISSPLFRSPALIRLWYETFLPRMASNWAADVVFSMTNYLPQRRLPCPALLLVQHAGHFSPHFNELMEAHIGSALGRALWRAKGRWVKHSVHQADQVTVQTRALAKRVSEQAGVASKDITVIPHGPGLVQHQQAKLTPAHAEWRIGCISKFGVQKDFATLFEAFALLRAQYPLRLVLSLDPSIAEFERLWRALETAGLGDLVENHGELAHGDIEVLYDSLDIAVFPSLCESFGFPLIEAMARALPVVAADIDSTRGLVGESAQLYQAGDAADLAAQIQSLLDDPQAREDCAKQCARTASKYNWERSAIANLELLEQMLRAGRKK